MRRASFFIAFFMFADGYCYDLYNETLQFIEVNNYNNDVVDHIKKTNDLFGTIEVFKPFNLACELIAMKSGSVKYNYDSIVLYNTASFYLLKTSFIGEEFVSIPTPRLEKARKKYEKSKKHTANSTRIKEEAKESYGKIYVAYTENKISTEKFIYLSLIYPLLFPIASSFVNENWSAHAIVTYFLEESSYYGLGDWLSLTDPLVFSYLLMVCDTDGDDFSRSTLMISLNNAIRESDEMDPGDSATASDTGKSLPGSSLERLSDHIWKYILLRSVDDNTQIAKWLSQNFKTAFPQMIACRDEHEFLHWLKGTGIENIQWDITYEVPPLRKDIKSIKHCTLETKGKRVLQKIRKLTNAFPGKKGSPEHLMLVKQYEMILNKIREGVGADQ
ncbi:hypothetical protein [Candidatus Sororendozoicomonas aggregata]|uniref:hypothetical protein n=1 Tax=Candidatus Sororendozoicomonas aggregata TaxID=3073239 RepID=UPI002ED29D56